MFEPMTGGCLCGAIRYRIGGPPMLALHCCCHTCQKSAGGDHASLMLVANQAVTLEGELRHFERRADSGNTVSRGFCPVCGSPVASWSSGYPVR